MTPEAQAFLAECRKQPTDIADGANHWPLVRELESVRLVQLERAGAHVWRVRPVTK